MHLKYYFGFIIYENSKYITGTMVHKIKMSNESWCQMIKLNKATQ